MTFFIMIGWIVYNRLCNNLNVIMQQLGNVFRGERMPDRDRLLKRKLLQGFPRNSRDLLEAFMDDNIPLNKLIGHVKNERLLLLQQPSIKTIPMQSRAEPHQGQIKQNSLSLSVNHPRVSLGKA